MLSGVPQGSVLGPLVFTMHTRLFGITVQRYDIKYHLYDDDTICYFPEFPRPGNIFYFTRMRGNCVVKAFQ